MTFAEPNEGKQAVRAWSRLFRGAATEAGLRGDAAWSAIYGEAALMPDVVFVGRGRGFTHHWR